MASVRHSHYYVFGNNLEAILEVLEEDDDFERDLYDSLTWSVLFNQIIWSESRK